MAPQVIVLGWDSATFDVTDPLIASGRLPALAALTERGVSAPLRSTWPPMTDCAWTSAFTGLNPGAHGIFGSWYRAPGSYECRYFSSRDRRAPALWELTESVRHLVWNVPMTFPPSEVDGVMLAGYGAPPGSRISVPVSFQERLSSKWDLGDLLDRAPHSTLERFLDDLLRGLRAQAEALPWAIHQSGADAVSVVWPHVDRAQHFFWRFRGTDHPLAGAVERVYEAMDEATGAIVEAFPGANVLVVSDHGAGDLRADVNVGAWLAQKGYARYGAPKRSGKARLAELAWKLPPPVRRAGRRLAPGVAREAMSERLAGALGSFEWSETQAFLGFHSDLWLNLEGREPQGIVPEARAEAVLDEILEGLMEIRDPATRERVFAGAHRRADIYSGPASGLAPDAILDTWSAGYRVAPARPEGDDIVIPPTPLAGVDAAWSADHRPLGILVGAGPAFAGPSRSAAESGRSAPTDEGTAAHRSGEADLYDLCPLVLALLGQPIPDGLDGKVPTGFLDERFLDSNPLRSAGATARRDDPGAPDYSADEAAAVAEHLKDLGYID